MTLQGFQQLSLDEKIKLTESATFLGKREELLQTIFLYAMGGFYCEVFWQKPQHYIIKVEGFDNPEKLTLYKKLSG